MEVKKATRYEEILFITGIPSKSSSEDVFDHFAAMGSIRLLRLRSSNAGGQIVQANPQNNIKKGFCLVQTFDQDTYQAILNSGLNKSFQGRYLIINKFRQGADLEQYNIDLASRRVIIKKVPADVPMEFIHFRVQSLFGKIHRIFRFEAESQEKAAKKKFNCKNSSFSVEFENHSSAQLAVSTGWLRLGLLGKLLQIEAFKIMKCGSNSEGYKSGSKGNSSQDTPLLEFSMRENYKMTPASTQNSLAQGKLSVVELGMEPLTIGLRKADSKLHYVRPTMAAYHSLRVSRFTTVSLGSPHFDRLEDRVRFNMAHSIGVNL